MKHVGAHRGQHRPRFLHVLGLAADHDRERPVLGPRHTTGHGRVDEAYPTLVQPLGHAARDGRLDRRHVDAQTAAHHAFEDTGRAEIGLLHVRRRWKHGDDDLGLLGRLGRRAGLFGAGPSRGREGRGHDVVGDDGEALLHEVGGHGCAHGSGADERDVHERPPSEYPMSFTTST